ncbi:hypothetical protein [Acidovorax sp.]|uniref:hypothetical protein n=1 Tax=Acidovorax sp. TaxID=1872122 RepID=UPI00391F4AF2
MFNTSLSVSLTRSLMAESMLQKCPGTGLHRITALPIGNDAAADSSPLVELPLVAPCTNAQGLRVKLHSVLGAQLRGYGLAVDPVRQRATVTLHVHLDDLQEAMRSLTVAFPTVQFGRVSRVSRDEVRRCH